MVRRLILLTVTVLLSWPAVLCLADAAAQLQQARQLQEQGKFDEAELLYKEIAAQVGATDDGLAAQEALTKLYIVRDKRADAHDAIEGLITQFRLHPRVAEVVDDIADAWREADDYDEALALNKRVVATWPDSEKAMWSQLAVVKLCIAMGDDPNAEAAFAKLLADYAGRNDIPAAVEKVGQEYFEARDYRKAIITFNQVIDNWPHASNALWAQAGIAKCNIALVDDANAGVAVEKLIAHYATDSDIADAVDAVADQYRQSNSFYDAIQLYDRVVTTWPQSEQAMGSQVSIARLHIRLGDYTAAEAATAKLVSQFAGNDNIATGVENIGEEYYKAGQYEKALPILKRVVDSWPQAEHALWAQMGLAKCYVRLGDDPNAQEAIEKLTSHFRDNQDLGEALGEIADAYEHAHKDVRAKEVYERITELADSDAEDAAALKGSSINVLIDEGKDEEALQLIDELISEYLENAQLEPAHDMFIMMALKYEGKGRLARSGGDVAGAEEHFRRAAAICNKVIEQLPEREYSTAWAHWVGAVAYGQNLGNYERGIEYCRQIVENWPDYDYVCYAQYMIGRYYKRLRDNGQVPEEQANAEIEAAWQAVIDKHPECGWRGKAYYNLGRLKFEREQFAEAAECYWNFMEEYADDQLAGTVLHELGRTYEKTGQLDLAVEVYGAFLKIAFADDKRRDHVESRIEQLKGEGK